MKKTQEMCAQLFHSIWLDFITRFFLPSLLWSGLASGGKWERQIEAFHSYLPIPRSPICYFLYSSTNTIFLLLSSSTLFLLDLAFSHNFLSFPSLVPLYCSFLVPYHPLLSPYSCPQLCTIFCWHILFLWTVFSYKFYS